MDNLNLVVKFMLAGDGLLQVKGATRIKVDGRGAASCSTMRRVAVSKPIRWTRCNRSVCTRFGGPMRRRRCR